MDDKDFRPLPPMKISVRPPNSVVLVRDADAFDLPRWSARTEVEATESCLAVGTQAEPDGTTTISLRGRDETTILEAFDGELSVPSKRVVVATVTNDVLLEQGLPDDRARVRVYVNVLTDRM